MSKTRIVTRSVVGLAAGTVAVLAAVAVPAQSAAASAPGDTHWSGTTGLAAASAPGDTHWVVCADSAPGDTHWGAPASPADTHW